MTDPNPQLFWQLMFFLAAFMVGVELHAWLRGRK